ncbi:hypothetical protein QBC35DRAFT_540107 [Podospora australis]|uniref:Uncharacterized protein n=1 Tax=Podospora australis TaxID=1536484 RepID=A0AAN6WM97_9PEZI|nr:hypothetical protein QBC35DRAFT_540107 [Podospora australis]
MSSNKVKNEPGNDYYDEAYWQRPGRQAARHDGSNPQAPPRDMSILTPDAGLPAMSNGGRILGGYVGPGQPSNQRFLAATLPLRGVTPQDRFKREVVGYGGNTNTSMAPNGASGRVVSGPAVFPAREYHPQQIPQAPGALNRPFNQPNNQPNNHFMPNTRPVPSHVSPSPRKPGNDGGYAVKPTAPQLLSHECQFRRFNPAWNEYTKNGKYGCNVVIDNVQVLGDELYDDPSMAKAAVARKALPVVQAWPRNPNPSQSQRVKDYAVKSAGMNHRARRADMFRFRANFSSRNNNDKKVPLEKSTEQNKTSVKEGGDVEMGGVQEDTGRDHTAMLEEIIRGMGITLPDSRKESAEVTRAFLEGLAVGSRLQARTRSRSRSPAARGRDVRERSYDNGIGRVNGDRGDRYRPIYPSRSGDALSASTGAATDAASGKATGDGTSGEASSEDRKPDQAQA